MHQSNEARVSPVVRRRPATPRLTIRLRAGIRRAETSPYVRQAMALPCDPRAHASPVREPLETDGPATCLI